ncbi:MAG: ATP-binding protein [Anaerolineae bacterium]|jgi:PAS domain S-box-containing protein|nr:ATP-binding protein [Anaerolineae bacterium]
MAATHPRDSLYRLLARHLPGAAVFLFDADLRCLIAEGQLLSSQGMSSSTLEGQSLADIYPDLEDLHAQYAAALAGTEQRREYVFGTMTFRLHTQPLHDDTGTLIACMGVMQDVTASRQAEESLRQSESRHRALLNALPDTMFVQNAEGQFTEYHAVTIEHATAAGGEILLGKTLRAAGFNSSTEDIFLRHIRRALKHGSIQTFEYTLPGTGGDNHFYEARMMALNTDEVMTLTRDITALKRTQEELSAHIEDLTILRQIESEVTEKLNIDYVMEMALDATLRLGNATAGFIALYDEDRHMLPAHVVGAYHPEQLREQLLAAGSVYQRIMQERKPRLLLKPADEPGYVRLLKQTQALILIPLVSRETPIGLLTLEAKTPTQFNQERFQMVQLITGRLAAVLDNARLYRQTHQQLAELQSLYAEVRKLEQLKTDMIRIASHDLRNPLAATLGYLNLLRDDADRLLAESQRAYLRQIETAVRKMQTITTGILSLERIEQMAKHQNMETVDLAGVVQRAYDETRAAAAEKQQQPRLEQPGGPVYVRGDSYQLHEAVVNLFSNAIKYTPEGGTIAVSLALEEHQAVLRVVDSGYGVPEAQQARLFQPFFRAKTQENQAIEGTGLGLHLVKNIVERHNGSMIFHSVRGTGSTFGFRLPLETEIRKAPVSGSTRVG